MLRGHQRHRSHRRVRQLSRRRRHGRSADQHRRALARRRRRPACSRSSSASRAATSSAARSSAAIRRRTGRRSTSTPIRSRAACTGGGKLDAEDVNRLNSYQDMNVGLGGYVIKDRALVVRLVPPPGRQGAATSTSRSSRRQTILNNYSGKVTYNLSTNNKLIGYTQPSQKKQPQRFDSWLLGVDTGINTTEATTWNQNFWAWVHKAEWNGVLSDNAFAEIRGGQYGYDWTNGVNGTGPALRRHRQQHHQRPQSQLGARAAPQPGARHHQLLQERLAAAITTSSSAARSSTKPCKDVFIDGFEEDILHVMQNNAKLDVILFQPGESIGGLRTYGVFVHDTWRVNNRLTAQPRRAHRSLPRLLARAGPPGQPLQSHGADLRRRRQLHLLEPAGAAPRHDLRHHRQRQDGVEGQLRQLLVESRRRLRVQRQPERAGVVAPLSLDRPQQRQPLATGRRRRADRRRGGVGHRIARSRPEEQLHQGNRDASSSAR